MVPSKLLNSKQNKSIEDCSQLLKSLGEKNNLQALDIFELRNELKKISNQQIKDIQTMIARYYQEYTSNEKKITQFQDLTLQTEKNTHQEIIKLQTEITEIQNKYNNIATKIDHFEINSRIKYSRSSIMSASRLFDSTNNAILNIPESAALPQEEFDIEEELNQYKQQLDEDLNRFKDDFSVTVNEKMQTIKEELLKAKNWFEGVTMELKDKLSWLPLSLAELNGMSPCDARLFTIEARLRAEENSRMLAINNIEKSLESIRKNSVSPLFAKNLEKKKHSRHNYSSDLLNKHTEPDRKTPYSDLMEGIIFDTYGERSAVTNYEHKRNKSHSKPRNSIELNKDIRSLRKVNPCKLFKK